MIEASADRQLRDAASTERLTFLLRWTTRPDLAAVASIPALDARSAAARDAYSSIKRDVVTQLLLVRNLTVHDLPGTGTVIVSGTAPVIRDLLPMLRGRKDVTVSANREAGSVA